MNALVENPNYVHRFMAAVAVGFGVQLALRFSLLKRKAEPVPGPPLSPTELGRLRGEEPAVALAGLYAAGAVDQSGANATGLRNPVDPFTFRVYEHVRAGGEVVPAGLRRTLRADLHAMERRLADRHLLVNTADRWLQRGPLIVFLAYGVIAAIPAIALGVPLACFGRTRAGDDLFDHAQRSLADFGPEPFKTGIGAHVGSPESVAFAVAVFGSAALPVGQADLAAFADEDACRWKSADGGSA